MNMGSAAGILGLLAGVVITYLVAEAISSAVIITFHFGGAAGMIIGMVIFAVVFFTILQVLQKYAGIGLFRFDGD
jgi:hypothetical protein